MNDLFLVYDDTKTHKGAKIQRIRREPEIYFERINEFQNSFLV